MFCKTKYRPYRKGAADRGAATALCRGALLVAAVGERGPPGSHLPAAQAQRRCRLLIGHRHIESSGSGQPPTEPVSRIRPFCPFGSWVSLSLVRVVAGFPRKATLICVMVSLFIRGTCLYKLFLLIIYKIIKIVSTCQIKRYLLLLTVLEFAYDIVHPTLLHLEGPTFYVATIKLK